MEEFDHGSDNFRWGKMAKTSYQGNVAYSSFFLRDEKYLLFDNVLIYDENEPENHVGKLMASWEDKGTGKKMVRVRWYLRPKELPRFNLDKNSKELFLAFGKGKGVTNENDLSVIIRKVKVLCTSKNPQNIQASEEDLKNAEHYYSRIYDVDLKRLSDVDVVVSRLGHQVLYNKASWLLESGALPGAGYAKPKEAIQSCDVDTGDASKSQEENRNGEPNLGDMVVSSVDPKKRPLYPEMEKVEKSIVKRQRFSDSEALNLLNQKSSGERVSLPKDSSLKLLKTPDSMIEVSFRNDDESKTDAKVHPVEAKCGNGGHEKENTGPESEKGSTNDLMRITTKCVKMESSNGLNSDRAIEAKMEPGRKTSLGKNAPVDRKAPNPTLSKEQSIGLNLEKRSIFRQLPWEEKLEQALPLERVIIVRNLDLHLTSQEVCDMAKSFFKGVLDARVLSQESLQLSSTGDALVIFNNRTNADLAVQELEEKCLISDTKRCVIGSIVKPPKFQKADFPGHVRLEKFRLSRYFQNEEMRKAVSTSHCSQPNTMEFEMAMEWWHLQERKNKCWTDLYKDKVVKMPLTIRKAGFVTNRKEVEERQRMPKKLDL